MSLQSQPPAEVGPGSYWDLSGSRKARTALTRFVTGAATGLLLAACTAGVGGNSSGSGSGTQSPAQYTVSVSVSGLTGVGLVLQNNGGDDLPVSSDGTFTFKTKLVSGNSYSITVYNQPDGPPQTCAPQNASGTVSDGDVTNVALVCANKTTSTDLVGGTVSGLQGSGLVLQINGGESVTIQSNGSFTFPTPLPSGASYVVSVVSAPNAPYENCTATNASGTTADTDVANVSIRCGTSSSGAAFTIGGTVQWQTGSGSVVLTDNGLDSVTVSSHGGNRPVSFTFGLPIPSGDSYNVTLRSNNASRSQSCAFTNASGVVQDGDVTNITVVCNAAPTSNVTSLQVTPAESSVVVGSSLQFAAAATYADGSTADVTSQATWTSSNPTAASIGATGLVTSVGLGQTQITATVGTVSASTTLTVTKPPSATLQSIQVTPPNPSIAKGASQQFTATGVYSDNSTQNLTGQVTWSSSSTAVATIGNNGLASAVGPGSTTISATFTDATTGKAITGAATLTVTQKTLQSIQVTPANPSIAKGASQQFAAVGVYSDNSSQNLTTQVAWSSSSTAVATIANNGVATAVGPGSTTISATFTDSVTGKPVTGTATLTVTQKTLQSIQVTPANPSIAKGATRQFTATGVYSDNTTQDLTTQATWGSSNTVVATIGNTGVATAVSPGSTAISAAFKDAVSGKTITGTATLTVTQRTLRSIEVTPPNPSIAKGTSQQFTATGVYSDNTTQDLTAQVAWSSSNTTVATISSSGFANSAGPGRTTIAASLGGISGSTNLTVTKAVLQRIDVTPNSTISIANGTKKQFTATGVYSDNTMQDLTTAVAWSSTSTKVATISNAPGSNGLATATGVGVTTIYATFAGVTSGGNTLIVTKATLQSIEVTPADPTIAAGQTQKFAATGIYSDMTTQDLTTQAAWSSTNTGVATVGDTGGTKGVATGVSSGSTTIMAAFGGITGSTTLTVKKITPTLQSIEVTPTNAAIAKGLTQRFKATGVYSDNSTHDLTAQVTWSSSDTGVATISNATGSNGLATSVATGRTTIAATDPATGIAGNTLLTVTDAKLKSIEVTPTNPTVPGGGTVQLTATGVYTDNSTQNLTTVVTWSSSNSTIASVSNAAPTQGLVTAAAGVSAQATITATTAGVSGSTVVTVTPPAVVLQSIAITPAKATIPEGGRQQFTATGVYSNGNRVSITNQVTWSSSDPKIAAISNAAGSKGLAQASPAGIPGSVTITATDPATGISGTAPLIVSQPTITLVSIAVTPNPAVISVAGSGSQQFTATGTYSNNSTHDITTSVTWSSNDTNVVPISNATGSQGLASGVGLGQTTVAATLDGVTGAANVTVNTLQGITVAPQTASINPGKTQQFTATGDYGGMTTGDLTTQVTWSSSDPNVATVSNAAGSQGLATAVGQGTTTITASFAGFTATASLTVAPPLVSITVAPADSRACYFGGTVPYSATGTYQDGTQVSNLAVTWTSSDTVAATIDAVSGVATPNQNPPDATTRTTTITAASGGVTGSTTLTVVSCIQ